MRLLWAKQGTIVHPWVCYTYVIHLFCCVQNGTGIMGTGCAGGRSGRKKFEGHSFPCGYWRGLLEEAVCELPYRRNIGDRSFSDPYTSFVNVQADLPLTLPFR